MCLLEDVITIGGTLLKAVERVREQNLNIVAVLGVLDREQGGRENLAGAGFELRTIFTRRELLETMLGVSFEDNARNQYLLRKIRKTTEETAKYVVVADRKSVV